MSLLLEEHALQAADTATLGSITQQSAVVTNTSTSGRSSITQARTVNAGTNTMMLVHVGAENAGTRTTSVTFNGDSLTKLCELDGSSFAYQSWWYRMAPDVVTGNVVVTNGGVDRTACGIFVLDGVEQDPFQAFTAMQLAKGSVALSTLNVGGWRFGTGWLLFSGLSIDSSGHAIAPGANQTQEFDIEMDVGANTFYCSTQAGADGGAMEETWTTAGPTAHIAFGVRPAASAGGVYALDAQPGSFSLTGVAASPVAGRVIDAATGSYTLTGILATLAKGYTLDAAPGSFALTGVAAGTLTDRVINATAGAYALTGVLASPVRGLFLSADPGVFTITGTQAAAVASRVLSADPGSFALTGIAASPVAGRVLSAEPGAFALTGVIADLLYGAGALNNYELNAETGVYTLSGVAASTVAARVLAADAGNYVLTGIIAGVLADRAINAAPGQFDITGVDASTLADHVLEAVTGIYAITGKAAGLEIPAVGGLEPRIRTILMSRFGIY